MSRTAQAKLARELSDLSQLIEARIAPDALDMAFELLWRAMIDFALTKARAGRYRYAARHLASCAEADMAITNYMGHPALAAYVVGLRSGAISTGTTAEPLAIESSPFRYCRRQTVSNEREMPCRHAAAESWRCPR